MFPSALYTTSTAALSLGGILLDLSETFTDFKADANGLVEMGISFRLADLNKRLAELNLFVPHGQCAHVHVGGHAHTGMGFVGGPGPVVVPSWCAVAVLVLV